MYSTVQQQIFTLESGGNPYAVNDNTNNQSFMFSSQNQALSYIQNQISNGNTNLDIGLGQVNLLSHPQYLNNPSQLLNPSVNAQASSSIFNNYLNQSGGNVTNALSMYNTGGINPTGLAYAQKVQNTQVSPSVSNILNGILPSNTSTNTNNGQGILSAISSYFSGNSSNTTGGFYSLPLYLQILIRLSIFILAILIIYIGIKSLIDGKDVISTASNSLKSSISSNSSKSNKGSKIAKIAELAVV